MNGTPTRLSRRTCSSAAGLALPGCSRQVSVSPDPNVLTLWYWTRSISENLLDVARHQIPGSTRRLQTQPISNFDIKMRTSLAGGSYIPDINGVNSNVSLYFPSQDLFLDMYELGA